MKKGKQLLLSTTLAISILALPAAVNATSYTAQNGDSFWKIANANDVSLANLQIANNRTGSLLYAGETITIPNFISHEDQQLMAKLVHAEAKDEPYAGKVAVATVVLNRIDYKDFPDSVEGVIYEKVKGHYAFSPVQDGAINTNYTAADMRAVNEAIAFRGQGSGSIYFYNPETATSDWIFSRDTTVTIGNHRFAK